MQSHVLSRGASLNRLSSPAALQPPMTLRAVPLPARTAQRQQQQQQQQQSRQQPQLVCRAQQQEGSAPAAAPAAAPAPPSPLLELNQENFYKYLEDNEDKLTVVDFYTDWCGPCKVMLPELYKLAEEMPHINVVKFNCNKQNKDLGKLLNIRVAPTFHLYMGPHKVSDMTGAKIDKLRSLIAKALGESGTDSDA